MLNDSEFLSPDGENHRVVRFLPADGPPRAVIVALHGFNDRANAFDGIGAYLAENHLALYAYDQRGFAATATRGFWPGADALARDMKYMTGAVRARYPGIPLYLLGESMGGAVVMAAMTSAAPPYVDGIVLSAPAVWGRSTMPFYQRWALDVATQTMPGLTMTGQGLDIQASDNIEMLRALGRDPLVIQNTRMDAVAGVTDLMDVALMAASSLKTPALILYGVRDQVVPSEPTLEMIRALPAQAQAHQRVALYENGWHMLLRDLQAKTVWADVLTWIGDQAAPLPSGADRKGADWRVGGFTF